jgi:hypothetical protein
MEKESSVDQANRFFDKSVSDRERAIFEGAITLGAIYHQFTGIPISSDPKVVKAVEQAIKLTMELQPYKEQVDVKIRKDQIKETKNEPYNYDNLKGSIMEVRVTAKYGKARATVTMKHVPGLNYDLMFIEKVATET